MKIKGNGPIRILTLAFALTLFAAYVVYSQLEHNRALAPSSKSLVLGSLEGTNRFVPTSGAKSSMVITQPQNSMVLSSSKSGPVFDPFLVKAAATNLDRGTPGQKLAQTNRATMPKK